MMSESVDNLILTPRSRILKDQTTRFEAAWQLAIKGGDPPTIDDFLSSVKEPERSRLVGELQRIECTYRGRIKAGKVEIIPDNFKPGESSAIPLQCPLKSPNPPDNPLKTSLDGESIAGESLIEPQSSSDPVDQPEASLATLRLPGQSPEPSVESQNSKHSALDSASIFLPLLDSWGRDVEAPPIPGTVRASIGPHPHVKGYEIIGELGRGGMGVVYKANQQGLNRLVAIKMVLGGDHAREEDLARFKIEAEAVASIQHPNIVQIYEVGDKDGTPYFSLEYIDGGTLHQRVDGKPLAPGFAAEIALQLAQAMQHFHDRGVIHRDLKPANVLMTLQGSPKITDFGLAKRLEGNSSQTRTGSLMGTPSYMAPEQASGDTRAIGPLSDLYSLGAVLYEMLTGRPPFQGATMLDTLDQVRSQEPVPPRRLQPKVPRDLETICLKCLQKEPTKRYPGAAELAGDLQRFLEGEPIKARPIGRIEMGWRWARRNPKIAIMSTSLILLGVVMVGLAITGANRFAREAQTINEAGRIARERLERARLALIQKGDVRGALDIIGVPDPFVERTPALSGVRDELRKLRAQVQTLSEFRRLLDLVRYNGYRGSKANLARAKTQARELIALYDEIETRKGRGEFGLPPLSEWELQLFKEDVFDAFLAAAQTEYDSEPSSKESEVKQQAARTAINWLDRAEKLLPPTKALYVRRKGFKGIIGDLAGAEADSKRGASIEPISPADIFWNGFAERSRGDEAVQKNDGTRARERYGLARDRFAHYLQVRNQDFWGRFEFATCNYRLGDYSGAILAYSDCINRRPEAAFPYHERARAHASLKEFDKAVLDETNALTRDPEFADAYFGRASSYQALGKSLEAIADFDAFLQREPGRFEVRFFRGNEHLKLERYEAALLDYDALIKANPKIAGAYQKRAEARFALRDFEGAAADWSKYSSVFPKDLASHYYVAIIKMSLRQYDEAIREFDACLALDPSFALASLAKARIYHWRANDAEALKLINQVIGRFDSSDWSSATKADYLNERVDLYRNLGRLDESEADARQSIGLDPKPVNAYLALALLERKRGKPADEILAWYDKMVEANPNSPVAHLRRAQFLRDEARWDEALVEVDKARALDPKDCLLVTRLIRDGIMAARGEVETATTDATAILKKEVRPKGPVLYEAACVWSLASRSAARAGDDRKANALAERATELLKRALLEGYHEINYQEQERMLLDPALEPIASRPEVRQLLSFLP